MGYLIFFFWGGGCGYDIFENKKVNKHKITEELLFCSMVSNFPVKQASQIPRQGA